MLGYVLRAKKTWWQRKISDGLPAVDLIITKNSLDPGDFFYPHPSVTANIIFSDKKVGVVHYCSDLEHGKLYILHLEVQADHRHQGYATSTLWKMCRSHTLTITPILFETPLTEAFWRKTYLLFKKAGIYIELLPDDRYQSRRRSF